VPLTQAHAIALLYIAAQPNVLGAKKQLENNSSEHGSTEAMLPDTIAGQPVGVDAKAIPAISAEDRAHKASLKAKHCGQFVS